MLSAAKHLASLAEILRFAQDDSSLSSLSIVEVAFAAEEKDARQLNPQSESAIDDIWLDNSVRLVEPMQNVM